MHFRAGLLPILALSLFFGAHATALAQGVWCARMLGGGESCGFATFGQCQAALSGNGGMCVQNPRVRNAEPAWDGEAARAKAEQGRAQRQYEQDRRRAAPSRPTPTPTPAAAPTPPAPARTIAIAELDTKAVPSLNREGIRRVQIALKGKGFDPGPLNGFSNPRLQAAIQTFQTAYGIQVRGVIDNQTLLALGAAELTGEAGR